MIGTFYWFISFWLTIFVAAAFKSIMNGESYKTIDVPKRRGNDELLGEALSI
jgi:hypothetical protein